MIKRFILISFVCLFFWNYESLADSFDRIGLPVSKTQGQVIKHNYYNLEYSEKHEQASWIMYKLTDSRVLKGSYKRTNDFRIDPMVKTGSAILNDYKGSGYDRGHLCPAGDMKFSKVAMSESFYMSNMSPQRPGFNRGIWKRLESSVRMWAVKNKEIYIVTAGILEKGLSTIGQNKVSIPQRYYKVILDYKEPEIKAIGFILPNKKSSIDLKQYAVTVDKIEAITGIDFFSGLPDKIEKKIESKINVKKWSFKVYKSKSKSTKGTNSVQCKGQTKSGKRCKRKTTELAGYCWQHKKQAR